MPQPFKMYRIICTITDKALVSGSNCPHDHLGSQWHKAEWFMRGCWSKSSGAFWRGEDTVRKHLQNLCHDWRVEDYGPRTMDYRMVLIPNTLDWSRLQHLRVEQITVTDYSTVKLSAADFMGMPDSALALSSNNSGSDK